MLLAIVAVAGPAAGAVETDFREHESRFQDGAAGEVVLLVPFRLTERASFYAKVLPTMGNAVNDGTPNGTVLEGGGTGWWVTFRLLGPDGGPPGPDADGRPVPDPLGTFASSTPSPAVDLDAGEHVLEVRVHVPDEAARVPATHRVVVALAQRAASAGDRSGLLLDPSRGIVETIVVEPPQGAIARSATPAGSPAPRATVVLFLLVFAALGVAIAVAVLRMRSRDRQ